MKHLYHFLTICLFSFFVLPLVAQDLFIANQGQWDEPIQYKSSFSDGNLFIEKNAFNFNFYDAEKLNHLVKHHHKEKDYHAPIDWLVNAHCVKMQFLGSNGLENVTPSKKASEYFNYYLGNNPNKWASKVPAYQNLYFENVYTNIDIELSLRGNAYKYDMIVAPNGHPNDIKIKYEGANAMQLKDGHLHVYTDVNTLIEQAPYAYQIINGKQTEVECAYVLKDNELSFSFPNGYDKNTSLIIDPFIVFSRYSSSFANNFGYTATFDNNENAYGAGSVFGTGYQTVAGSYEINFSGGTVDVGITKYTSDGLNRMYATYLGGSDTELPHSLVVNSRDELYVFGTTSSLNFPIDTNLTTIDGTYNGGNFANFTNGLGVNYNNGSDLFVARFSEDGSELLASTYLGGSANDGLNTSSFLKYNYADEVRGEVLVDDEDNCYVVTCTFSNDFPIENGFQSNNAGGSDAVIIKMDDNLTDILWSSFLGGSDDDAAYSIAFDNNQNLVIAGGTRSTNFPLNNALVSSYQGGASDGFITRIHPSGSGILASTYYGTNDYDQIYFVETNDLGEVYIFGQTNGPSGVLVENALYQKPGGGQLLAKFNQPLDDIVWSTRFGDEAGVPDISPTAFLVDVCDQVFLSGWGSQNLGGVNTISGAAGLDVTADALDNTTDNADFYFMVMRNDASALIYASYFGGQLSAEHVDGGTSRFDKKGVVYQAVCAGCGNLQDFPTVPADSIPLWTNNNSCNLGLVKYAFTPPSIVADFDLPEVDCVPISLFFENTSQTAFNDTSNTSFYWEVNDSTINSYHLNYDFTTAGSYTITLFAIDSNSCNLSDSISKQITIIGNGFTVLDTVTTCNSRPVQIGIPPISGNNISYDWTPTTNLSSNQIPNPFASPINDITYTLIITNGNCQDTLIQPMIVENLNIDIDIRDSVCLGDTVTATLLNGNGAFIEWTPADAVQSGQGSEDALFILNESLYIGAEATNNEGCTSKDSVFVTLITDLPDVVAEANPDTIFMGESSELLATSLDVNEFSWLPDSTLSELTISDPIATPLATTTYTVQVRNELCPNKADVTVYVLERGCVDGEIFVPNAFTPNADNNNDEFLIRTTIDIEDFYLAVYDRWGQLMFESRDINVGWNGTFDGKVLSSAAFAWYVEGSCPNEEPLFLKGNVTLIH